MTLEEMIRLVSELAAEQLNHARECDDDDYIVAFKCRETAGALLCVENELRALAARQARAQD